jgi:hypothetical protein
MLQLLDVILTLVHFFIIGFCLLGWIVPKWRKAHLICILLIAFSWLVLGIWFGVGYCFLTDWQWQVKQKLGEHNLPNSFTKYYADKLTGRNFSTALVDKLTAISFALAAMISIVLNLWNYFRKRW